jgi:hypothetical protein
MRSIEPLRELFHLHPGDADWTGSPHPHTACTGTDAWLEPLGNTANDWEQYWIDLGGEG